MRKFKTIPGGRKTETLPAGMVFIGNAQSRIVFLDYSTVTFIKFFFPRFTIIPSPAKSSLP